MSWIGGVGWTRIIRPLWGVRVGERDLRISRQDYFFCAPKSKISPDVSDDTWQKYLKISDSYPGLDAVLYCVSLGGLGGRWISGQSNCRIEKLFPLINVSVFFFSSLTVNRLRRAERTENLVIGIAEEKIERKPRLLRLVTRETIPFFSHCRFFFSFRSFYLWQCIV